MDLIEKKINNASFLVKDLLEGEDSVTERKDFISLSPQEINKALQIINKNTQFSEDTKKYLLMNTWKINYKVKPPTMKEFLTEEWLGETANCLFDYIKDALIAVFDSGESYRNILLYFPIGSGKSFLTAIANLYVATIVYMMRNPRKTLGLNASSIICNVFLSYSLDKAIEVLLAPFKEIMMVSPKFEKCRTLEQMLSKEKEYGTSKICWTTAGGSASAITFGPNMSFKIKSSIPSLLGLTILCGSVTELGFFKDAGYSDEDIMRLYNDLKGRIFSRFPDAFWAKSILDSSPNDASFESSIDSFILNIAPRQLDPKTKKPVNLILQDRKWNLQPWLFPEWEKDKTKVFYIFLGGKDGKLPKILESKEECQHYNEEDVIECPLDCLILAQDDLQQFLKNYAGIPAGTSDRLIHDNTKIEAVFVPHLKNIYSHITALESEQPEHLIWNKIASEFFIEISTGQFEFYRNPKERRYVSIDQSISGDTAAIAVTHPELTLDGEIIDIVDMTVCIIPNKFRINLDAIKFFIYDLWALGHLSLDRISFDQFQSEPAQQFLRRANFEVEHLSVDSTTAPYLNLVQEVNLGRIKMGRNIYAKNNFKSIKLSKTKGGKTKVDHENGKICNDLHADDNWKTSALGFNSKDCLDAVSASIALRQTYFKGAPRYIYEEPKIEVAEKSRIITLSKENKTLGLMIKTCT